MTIGFDLDGVISSPRFKYENEKLLWFLQGFRFLQKIYNFLIRKPNLEIKKLMENLREKGIKLIIISASNANYREELERWLIGNEFYHFETLILKESFKENCMDYKKRIVPANCDFYLDDKEKMVQFINDSNDGRCRAIHYQGQTKEELFQEFLPIFVLNL